MTAPSLHSAVGEVPSFHHPRGGGVLALPEDLFLTPSPELAAEVNRFLGYPALSL